MPEIPRLRVHDPERVALRRAARAAVLAPPIFALGLFVLDDETFALFAVFGVIAMFAFVDFGGPLPRRAAAYAGLTVVGAALIPPGTLLSGRPFAAAGAMAAVAFAIVLAGAAGGYVAGGGAAATLAFVLSVAVPASASDIPSRLLGWSLAGAVVTVAAVTLWPAQVRGKVRAAAAVLADSLAELAESVANGSVGRDAPLRRVQAASADLLEAFLRLRFRPSGPTVRDQAMVYLVAELRRGADFAEAFGEDVRRSSANADDRALLRATAVVLAQIAAALRGADGELQPAPLEEQRDRHLEALQREAGRVEGEEARRLVRRAFDIRILSYIAFSSAVNAALVLGRRIDDTGFTVAPLAPRYGVRPALVRLRELARANLRRDSVVLQAAVRAAIGLGIAVLVALLAKLDHGFWVVLGTLSALKSSALTTAYTAWQALVGTVAGFALSSALLFASGERHPALWAILVIGLFLAVYTPTAVHAIVGQAMFTVAVVVLFNILEPQGWRTGLVRVEDILIGCGTSVVVGTLLWPRGAGAQLRIDLASLYERGSRYVRAAFGRALGRLDQAETAERAAEAREAALRAVDAFATFLGERGPKPVPLETWAQLAGGAHQVRFVGDAILVWVRSYGPVAARPPDAQRLEEAAELIERDLNAEARTLLSGEPGDGRPADPAALDEVTAPAVGDPVGVLVLREWLARLEAIADDVRRPVAEVAELTRRPWWRQ